MDVHDILVNNYISQKECFYFCFCLLFFLPSYLLCCSFHCFYFLQITWQCNIVENFIDREKYVVFRYLKCCLTYTSRILRGTPSLNPCSPWENQHVHLPYFCILIFHVIINSVNDNLPCWACINRHSRISKRCVVPSAKTPGPIFVFWIPSVQ